MGADDIQVAKHLIVTGERRRFLASEQLWEVGIELGAALLEPVGRNTAPALTLAALAAKADEQDPVLVVTPADQTVANTSTYTQAVREAKKGSIIILGITLYHPETGYGHIQISRHCEERSDVAIQCRDIQCFVEKPDASTAQQYLAEGGYYWNAGMFVLKASVCLKALEQFRPDILQATQAAVTTFFAAEKPGQVYLAAAKVGGIHTNNIYPAEFICKNLMMQANVIDAGLRNGVQKLLFHGSSYFCPQPMREDTLLTGMLETIRILCLEKKNCFYQVSTSELFGLVQEIPQKETMPFYPRSPYAVAKMYAY